MKIIDIKDIQDPALNLAIEEYALRHLDRNYAYLLFYTNHSSIIIGRNQNYFEEVNHAFIDTHQIPVYRRISGGGAVYHDPGNLNFSIITDYNSKWLNNYEPFNKPVINALQALHLPAYMDNRNAIRINQRKISGNAQFSASGRMFSHGTLLFDANLANIKNSLDPDMPSVTSRAHQSVRSEIVNIRPLLSHAMDMEEFKNHLLHFFTTHFNEVRHLEPYHFDDYEWSKIKKIKRNRYDQWEWNIGKSPRFSFQKTIKMKQGSVFLDVEVNKGVIRWISLESNVVSGPFLHAVEQKMHNTQFCKVNLKQNLQELSPLTGAENFVEQFVEGIFKTSTSVAS